MKATKKSKIISFTFLFLFGILWLIPVVWLLFNSFKTDADFITSFGSITGPLDYLSPSSPKTGQ